MANQIIHGYEMLQIGINEFEMPCNARVLCVQVEKDVPVLYAEFNESQKANSRWREFQTMSTGKPFAAPAGKRLVYVGSFFYVSWAGHVYELVPF